MSITSIPGRRVAWRLTKTVAFGLFALVLVFVLWQLLAPIVVSLVSGQSLTPWPCKPPIATPELWASIGFMSLAVVSFAITNIVGVLRYHPAPPSIGPGQAVFYQSMITLFFLTVALVLLYEAFGTWATDVDGDSPWWPITWYVRCAIKEEPAWSVAAISGISGLLGHWLHKWISL